MDITNLLTSYLPSSYMIFPVVIWYLLGYINRQTVDTYARSIGVMLSTKCKNIPYWKTYIEPILLQRLSIIVTIFYSFMFGLLDDNSNKNNIEKKVEDEIKNDISHEENIKSIDPTDITVKKDENNTQ